MRVGAEKYYAEINAIFDRIESSLGLEVIIAAHPRANIEISRKMYAGRRIVLGNTAKVVKSSKLVLFRFSNSIVFGVMAHKPIVLLCNQEIEKVSYFRDMCFKYAEQLNLKILKNANKVNRTMLSVDTERYTKFIRERIAYKEVNEPCFWMSVVELVNKKYSLICNYTKMTRNIMKGRVNLIDYKENTMMYKVILWDLDGTLLDTSKGVKNAVKHTIEYLGLRKLEEHVLDEFVGPPMQFSFQKYYAMGEAEALQSANVFREIYKEQSLFEAELYPNTLETLTALKNKGYIMALATNKSHDNAIAILKHFCIAKYFEVMQGADLEGRLKKADIILKCMDELKISAHEAVYIGDSMFDVEGARKAGINFYGVSYGFGFREENEYQFKLFKNMKEIKERFCEGFER